MTLTEQLQQKKEASKKYPEAKKAVMFASTQALIDEQLSTKAVQVGQQVPNFTLPDVVGKEVSLSDLLAKGRVVLSFYRGGWCPYCNLELRALQAILPEMNDLGTSLVAISPEVPDQSLSTSEKNELSFSVLSDVNNVVAKKLGLVFQLPEDLREVYDSFGIDVPAHNGNQDYELPMPATYILNQDGTVAYAFIPEDYRERLDPETILEVLKG